MSARLVIKVKLLNNWIVIEVVGDNYCIKSKGVLDPGQVNHIQLDLNTTRNIS